MKPQAESEGTRCLEGAEGPDSWVVIPERLGFWTLESRGGGSVGWSKGLLILNPRSRG